LAVVVNESFEDFAKALQKEIEQDCGVDFAGRVKEKLKREKVKLSKGHGSEAFMEIWNKVKYCPRYIVKYDTSYLITLAAKAVKEMPETQKPSIRSTKKKVLISEKGVEGQLISDSGNDYDLPFEIPDMLGYIQGKTELTRSTILEILKRSGRISELLVNPQLFMDNTVGVIKSELYELMIGGIMYEKIGDKMYEMKLFEDNDLEIYLDNFTHIVSNPDKTIYENYIPLDSTVENDFAKDCQSSENIEFYFKLPFWFKIDTPIGSYNPDWAIVFKGEKKIYFVAETKSAGQELRGSEKMKVKCGRNHFREFKDVKFEQVSKVEDLR
jgi:type III restriction enzyme